MSFRRFIRACNRYDFHYALSTHGGTTLILRPRNTFDNITLEYAFPEYRKIFRDAVRAMKVYRESHK